MTELALVGATLAGIALPHALPLDRVTPSTAAATWILALLLRALVAIGAALFLVADLHGADPPLTVNDWHPQHALSALSATLDVAVHPAAHLLALIPLLALGGSLVVFAIALVRGWWLLRRMLRSAIDDGPFGTTVVPDDRVLVAVAGMGRGRILLSDAALARLDLAELDASVAHERGHIRRAHRPLLLLASLLAALAWMLPGTRIAKRQLVASLERDADDYAVRATGDRLALASAICKAAMTAPLAGAVSLRGPGPVAVRLERLVGDEHRAGPVLENSARSLVVLLVSVTAVIAELVISLVLFGPGIGHLFTLAGTSGSH
jgi:Zn-dependent protease with chaperone function